MRGPRRSAWACGGQGRCGHSRKESWRGQCPTLSLGSLLQCGRVRVSSCPGDWHCSREVCTGVLPGCTVLGRGQGPHFLCYPAPPCPVLTQALEDRGIVELLLTSDNKDGLSKGVVDGGMVGGDLSPRCEATWGMLGSGAGGRVPSQPPALCWVLWTLLDPRLPRGETSACPLSLRVTHLHLGPTGSLRSLLLCWFMFYLLVISPPVGHYFPVGHVFPPGYFPPAGHFSLVLLLRAPWTSPPTSWILTTPMNSPEIF